MWQKYLLYFKLSPVRCKLMELPLPLAKVKLISYPFFQLQSWLRLVYCLFAVERVFFNTGESVIDTQRTFHVHFMFHYNHTVSGWKFYLKQHHFWQKKIEMTMESSMLSNYKFTSLKVNVSPANTQCAWVQSMIITDCIWKKKTGKTLDRESYHCHLPKFAWITNMGGISTAPCIIISERHWGGGHN